MYSIGEVAKISGISTRTLRYYDEIDLFHQIFTTTTDIDNIHQSN